MAQSVETIIEQAMAQSLDRETFDWLSRQSDLISQSDGSVDGLANAIAVAMPMVKRKVGTDRFVAELPLHTEHQAALQGSLYAPGHWSRTDACRVLLMLKMLSAHSATSDFKPQAVLDQTYRFADDEERSAMMKGLYWLDPSGNLTSLAVDAGRTNSVQLFSAVALYNPYPAVHYSSPQYNQLVLKALFLGLNIEHMVGLRERRDSELTRMCCDYVRERLAASRPIPPSLWLAVDAAQLDDAMGGIFEAHMCDNDVTQRFYTVMSLAWLETLPEGCSRAVARRCSEESDPAVTALLEKLSCRST